MAVISTREKNVLLCIWVESTVIKINVRIVSADAQSKSKIEGKKKKKDRE